MNIAGKAGLLGAAFGAAALVSAAAGADEASKLSFTGNIALTTDYVFRGISQSNSEPAVQGGFDATDGQFYAGTWASSISFAPMEWDVYGGIRPTLGAIALDIGAIGYLYPSAHDDAASFDYWEGYVKASISPSSNSSLGAAFYVSPDFFGETGTAYYVQANGSISLTKALSISGAVGYQSIDDINGPAAGAPSADYATWNLGATYTIAGFALDLRYADTNIGASDPIVTNAFTDVHSSKARVIFSISRTM